MNSPASRRITFLRLPRLLAHPEAHAVSLHAENALIGDRHPVRVATKILQYLRRAAERLFGIHHPVVAAQSGNEIPPQTIILCRIVTQAACLARRVERIHELAPVYTR